MPNRRVAPRVVVILSGVLAMIPAVVTAAPSPSPTAGPSASAEPSFPPHEGRPPVEAWLDRPIPRDPEPGSRLEIGVVLWDPSSKTVESSGTAIFIRVHAAGAEAPPIDTSARQDWRGHYIGRIGIPADGLGQVEFGVRGTACDDTGCVPNDWLFPVAGSGPPPGAPVTSLATASIDPPPAPLVAGEAADVVVRLRPNAGLDAALFAMPGSLMVRAHEPRGPNVATAVVTRSDAPDGADGAYRGSLTIPEAGDMVLEAATDADGGDATRFGTSLTRVAVEPASNQPLAAAGELPWPAIAVIALLAGAALVLVIRPAGRRGGS